ncbi:MAG: type II secretion system minor pseudopilin GspJ [Gammaproteobacteria bacterium]|nr:type II secretion system minor pseudopilin GspJ [Gammaproteobacteria bacterium]
MTGPVRAEGFTLVELLVALAVFALLAVMAYGGLGSTLTQLHATEERAGRTAELQHAVARLERDLSNLVARPVRGEYGDALPALASLGAGPAVLELTRGGWRNPAGAPRSHLQRVAYRHDGERLIRASWRALDRAQDSEPVEQVLIEGVREVRARFLDTRASWHETWPPAGAHEASLPRAIDLRLELEDWGELRRLVRVTPEGGDGE